MAMVSSFPGDAREREDRSVSTARAACQLAGEGSASEGGSYFLWDQFGDLDDPGSEVCRLIRERGGFQLQPELGTDPSVYYLPP